jgi:hypothetical protein
MHRSIMFGIITASLAAAGCTEARSENGGPVAERDFKVGDFDRIELAGAYDTTVRTGSAPSVHAKGNSQALDDLEVAVRNGTLVISHKKRSGFNWRRQGKLELTVTVPSLRGAELAGAGDIRVDRVAGDSFEGRINGAGDLHLERVEVGSLKLAISGAGTATAKAGSARNVNYSVAGAGDIHAKDVSSETASVSIAGAGGVSARATKTANVSIMGAGDVNLTGGAKCTISKMGPGDVHCS